MVELNDVPVFGGKGFEYTPRCQDTTPPKDTPLSKAKLVARLKQYMVDTNKTTMDPNLFFWCTGGNSRVAALLIDIANNEFEMGDGE